MVREEDLIKRRQLKQQMEMSKQLSKFVAFEKKRNRRKIISHEIKVMKYSHNPNEQIQAIDFLKLLYRKRRVAKAIKYAYQHGLTHKVRLTAAYVLYKNGDLSKEVYDSLKERSNEEQ